MQCARRYAAAGEMSIDLGDTERKRSVANARALDLRNMRTKMLEDGRFGHGITRLWQA